MFGPIIYRRDAKSSIRHWRYEVIGDAWRTHHGLVDGATTEGQTSGWTTCTAKSRPTAEEQALFEAEAEMGKKLDRDYRVSIELVDTPRKAGPKPMLAHKFEPDATVPLCFGQPKLDGIRCIANRDGLWTRQGKPIVACPHVSAALAPWFALDPDLVLDGELYNHELKDDFNTIASIVRKTKVSDAELELAEAKIQYHVYDLIVADVGFSGRSERLRQLFGMEEAMTWPVGTLSLVPTIGCSSKDELDGLYAMFLAEGYEGQMVRARHGMYEHKRSKNLLKRKEFLSEEFEIVRIESGLGNWAGYGKRLIFKLNDGRTCGAGIKGSQSFTKMLLEKADELVGKQVTVRFFTPTPDGMPRFPVAVDFHLDENGRVD